MNHRQGISPTFHRLPVVEEHQASLAGGETQGQGQGMNGFHLVDNDRVGAYGQYSERVERIATHLSRNGIGGVDGAVHQGTSHHGAIGFLIARQHRTARTTETHQEHTKVEEAFHMQMFKFVFLLDNCCARQHCAR